MKRQHLSSRMKLVLLLVAANLAALGLGVQSLRAGGGGGGGEFPCDDEGKEPEECRCFGGPGGSCMLSVNILEPECESTTDCVED